MPVAPSSRQFERTCPGNSSTKVWITFQPAVGQRRDRVRWNPPVEGNRVVQASKHLHGYRGQQQEKGIYLRGHMSARVGKGLIGVHSPRGIEWCMSLSVPMPIPPSSRQFESTCLGNSSTKVGIMFQPAVGQGRDRMGWNPPVEGNRIVQASKHPHGYRGQQDQHGRYLRVQMSTRVGKGLIGVRTPRGIEWYRSLSVPMPISPSSRQFERTCLGNSSTKVWITFQPAVGQRRDIVRWNPPVEGNRVVYISKRPHGYRGQQDEKGRYLRGQMSARVGKGLI